MNPERRKHLEQRRRDLRARLRREKRKDLIRSTVDALDQRGVPYDLVFDTDPLWDWLGRHFPTTSTHVAWDRVSVSHQWEQAIGFPADFAERLGRAHEDDARVDVLYTNGRAPALQMRFPDVRTHIDPLTSRVPYAWMLCRSEGWLFEFVAGWGWSFGRADGS